MKSKSLSYLLIFLNRCSLILNSKLLFVVLPNTWNDLLGSIIIALCRRIVSRADHAKVNAHLHKHNVDKRDEATQGRGKHDTKGNRERRQSRNPDI